MPIEAPRKVEASLAFEKYAIAADARFRQTERLRISSLGAQVFFVEAR